MADHDSVVQVNDLAAELMTDAKQHHSQRSARTVASGSSQRVTLIAMAGGAELGKHDSPVAATLQVVAGRVRLHTADREWLLGAGELVSIPVDRHAVDALEDAAILLTVALR